MGEIIKRLDGLKRESDKDSRREVLSQAEEHLETGELRSKRIRLSEDEEKITALREQLVEQIDQRTTARLVGENFKPAEIMIPTMKTNTDSNLLYSGIAKIYDVSLWLSGYKLTVHYFIGLIPFDKKAKLNVLDAGCGTGMYTLALLKKFPNATVHAFDLNVPMTDKMKRTVERKGLANQVEIFTGDVTQPIPFEHEQFDLIMTGGVLEYVDPAVAVKNLAPYLKKGGYFLNSPIKDSLLGKIVGKLYRFKPHTQSTNINAFTDNNFSLEEMRSLPVIKEAHLFRKL